MNKRLKKKIADQVLETLKPGQGLIVGNKTNQLRHFLKLHEVVEVRYITDAGSYMCYGSLSNIEQAVHPEDIVIKP